MNELGIAVETGPNNSTIIRFYVGTPQEQAVQLDGTTALRLGRAIISCGMLAFTPPLKPPVGTRVVEALLPTMHWDTAKDNKANEPVLILEIPGGLKLAFQMPEQTARECGAKLVERGTPPEKRTMN